MSLPGRVASVRGPLALVVTVGVERWCNARRTPKLAPGDRVLLHAGLAVRVLTDDEAREVEAAFGELGVLSTDAFDRVSIGRE